MKSNILVLLFFSVLMFTSCRSMKTATPVGDYTLTEGRSMTYSKAKQVYIFNGLIRLGRTTVATPPVCNFEIRTYRTFLWDRFVSYITLGIITVQTIEVRVKPDVYRRLRSAEKEGLEEENEINPTKEKN